jgi:hypothetical protein
MFDNAPRAAMPRAFPIPTGIGGIHTHRYRK